MNDLPTKSLCDEPGCEEQGSECIYPDGSDGGRYCAWHAETNGFCRLCGAFSAGTESFSFGPDAGLCDDCRIDQDRTFYRYDEDDTEWPAFDDPAAEAAEMGLA